jgi:hypothetical protein
MAIVHRGSRVLDFTPKSVSASDMPHFDAGGQIHSLIQSLIHTLYTFIFVVFLLIPQLVFPALELENLCEVFCSVDLGAASLVYSSFFCWFPSFWRCTKIKPEPLAPAERKTPPSTQGDQSQCSATTVAGTVKPRIATAKFNNQPAVQTTRCGQIRQRRTEQHRTLEHRKSQGILQWLQSWRSQRRWILMVPHQRQTPPTSINPSHLERGNATAKMKPPTSIRISIVKQTQKNSRHRLSMDW